MPRKMDAGNKSEFFMARSYQDCAAFSWNTISRRQFRCRSASNRRRLLTTRFFLCLERGTKKRTGRFAASVKERPAQCKESEQKVARRLICGMLRVARQKHSRGRSRCASKNEEK